jgi:la-related protein 1
VRDMFLRQHMDVDGYVPLAFVGSFQAVFAVHQDYPSLLEAVKHSETLELDEENEKIRPRNNWKQWLWPNGDGTLGVPRYIKLKDDDAIDASS